MLLLLLACFVDAGPCQSYCDYICECHADEPEFSCDECYTVNGGSDPELQDACETSLADQRAEDEAEGHECTATADSGAG